MRYLSVFSLAKGPERGSKIKTTPTTLIIPTPAKYHIKNCDPVLSHASKGPEGGLDLCLHQVVMKSPILPALWCQRLSREPRHSSQPSNIEAPTPAVSVEVPGEPGLLSHLATETLFPSFPSPLGWYQRRPVVQAGRK